MTIKIDKNIKMPERGKGYGTWIKAIRQLSVGDSFVAKFANRSPIYTAASRAGVKISVRQAYKCKKNEIRVFRVNEK